MHIVQIKDHLLSQRSLGLGLDAMTPDATTIRLFGRNPVQAKAIDKHLSRHDAEMTVGGHPSMGGQIIDVTMAGSQAARYRRGEGRPSRLHRGHRKARVSIRPKSRAVFEVTT